MAFIKPSNLIATKVYQAIQAAAADITFSVKQIAFNGLGFAVKLEDILAIKQTAFAAGTKQITTVDYTAITAADNTIYTTSIRRLDTGDVKTYQIISGTGATTATIAEAFNVAINNDLGHIVTSARAASTLTLTEVSVDTQGFLVSAPTGAVVTITTPHVDDSGTLAEVQVYDATITSGQYKKYEFTVNVEVNSAFGAKNLSAATVIIWANESDGDFAAFNTKIQEILSASTLADAAAQPYVELV